MSDLNDKEDALKVLDMFLCKQCDLERTSFAYDQITVWGAVKMATDALAEIGKQAAEPEVKKILYTDCANAMLMMWMNGVLTDGEYNRIMDKLNEHEKKKGNAVRG